MTILRIIFSILLMSISTTLAANVTNADNVGISIFSEIYAFSLTDAKANAAIQSWIINSKYVFLVVSDPNDCTEITQQFGDSIHCVVHHCLDQTLDLPIVSCLLHLAESLAPTNNIIFLNADIILSSVQNYVDIVARQYRYYTIVGQRIDVHDNAIVDIPAIFEYAKEHGSLHEDWGIDYYIFSKGSLPISEMPPFVLANIRWDNWLVASILMSPHTVMVDATNVITSVHIGLSAFKAMLRPGAIRNEMLWKKESLRCSKYGLGRVSYASYSFSSEADLLPSPLLPEINIMKIVSSALHSSGCVLLVTLTSSMKEVFENWLIWVQKLNLKFVVLAMDRLSLELAKSLALPVIHPTEDSLPNGALDSSKLVQEQTKMLVLLVDLGFCFLAVSPTAIIIDDPLGALFRHTQFEKTHWHEAFGIHHSQLASSKGAKELEGFFGVYHCIKKASLQNLQTCQNSLSTSGKQCIAKGFVSANSYFSLPPAIATTGKEFFEAHSPQQNAIYPAVLLPNHLTSQNDIINLYKLWGFWKPESIKAPPFVVPSTSCEFRLKIRVITTNKTIKSKSLDRLLTSLTEAKYDGDKVDLEIFIDVPAEGKDSKYQRVVDFVKKYKWKHGNFAFTILEKENEAFNVWVQPVIFEKVDDACLGSHRFMLLEDSVAMSPNFYMWGKVLTMKYITDVNDRKMYGIALQRQHTIISGPNSAKVGRYLDQRVDDRQHMYRYQLFSTWGVFLNSKIWNNFVEWATSKHLDATFKPCLPYFNSNKEYLENPKKHWSHWFNHYSFRNGLFGLYVNYNKLCPKDKCTLAHNYAEKGLHSEGLFKKMPPKVSSLTPLAHYSIYDFSFSKVNNEASLRERWWFLSGIQDSCVVNQPA